MFSFSEEMENRQEMSENKTVIYCFSLIQAQYFIKSENINYPFPWEPE